MPIYVVEVNRDDADDTERAMIKALNLDTLRKRLIKEYNTNDGVCRIDIYRNEKHGTYHIGTFRIGHGAYGYTADTDKNITRKVDATNGRILTEEYQRVVI